MSTSSHQTDLPEAGEKQPVAWPSVSLVFLVHNRRDDLRTSLRRMLFECDYDADRIEVIVVDNASTDGSSGMVASEYPQARLITRSENVGVSGFNDGFAAARGDYVLALDDDCYLGRDGLRRAVSAAEDAEANLVSFGIASSFEPDLRFDKRYRTGLLTFWGCAVLMRRSVLEELGGYDPEIFVWANELEFMLRFFDRGFRHLHLPELEAVHMKETRTTYRESIETRQYRLNARHFAYIAAKHLRPRDATGALVALLASHVRDAIRVNPAGLRAIPHCLSGFGHGLRRREPVTNPDVSHVYRRNFVSFASPWWVSRPLIEFIRPRGDPGRRRAEYFASRSRYYPKAAETLEF